MMVHVQSVRKPFKDSTNALSAATTTLGNSIPVVMNNHTVASELRMLVKRLQLKIQECLEPLGGWRSTVLPPGVTQD